METECQWHAPPAFEDRAEDQTRCEDSRKHAQPGQTRLEVAQRKDTGRNQYGHGRTQAVDETRECVAAVDQFLAHVVQEVEPAGSQQDWNAEACIRMPARPCCDSNDDKP